MKVRYADRNRNETLKKNEDCLLFWRLFSFFLKYPRCLDAFRFLEILQNPVVQYSPNKFLFSLSNLFSTTNIQRKNVYTYDLYTLIKIHQRIYPIFLINKWYNSLFLPEYFKSINTYWDKTWYVPRRIQRLYDVWYMPQKVLETEIWKVKSYKFNNDVIQKMPQASGIHDSLQNSSDNNTIEFRGQGEPRAEWTGKLQ